MRWIILALLAGSALIAGCSKHEAATSSPPAATPGPGPAVLFARPHPKAGLWRTTMTTNAGPGVSMTGELCLDASNENSAFSPNGKGFNRDCDPIQHQSAAGGYGFTVVCHMGKRTVTTTGVASGDFSTNYSVDLTSRIEPSEPGLPGQLHTTVQARWEGPCPAGTKPGLVSTRLAGLGQG